MSEKQMTVLTRDSIVALRGIAHSDPSIVWENTLGQLVSDYNLATVAVEVEYLRGHEFLVGAPGERKYDMPNAQTLWDALPTLTPSQATDERLWVTLALGDFKDYMLKRWSKVQKTNEAVWSKIFVNNTRSLIRDHAISRLWWRAYFASLVPKTTGSDPLQLFFEHEDIPGEIAGRSILADSRVLNFYLKTLARGLEDSSSETADIDQKPKKYIQGVGKQLNFLSGRFQLGAVSDSRLEELMDIAHRNALLAIES